MLLGSFAPSLLNFRAPLIRALVGKGHIVYAVAPDISLRLGDRIRALGAEPICFHLSRSSLNPAGDLVSFRALRGLMRSIRPDVLIPYTIKPVVWGTLAARSAGVGRVVPLITGVGFAFTGGVEPRRLAARIAAMALYRLALRHADIVLFQNPDDMALFRRLGMLLRRTRSAVVNGTGVDLTHFSQAPLPERTAFLMMARLLGDKGIREFAAAACIVKSRHPDVPIRLAGFTDETPDSIDQAEVDAIIASGVEFLGRLDDVRPAIAGASVYVLPSYREGTPRSTLEAMAMGRAIITTDAPGCRETVVDGYNGFLVPVRDSRALADAMERFVLNPDMVGMMGIKSRRIVESKYDVDLVNSEIIRHAGL